jgi:hypothetical protein
LARVTFGQEDAWVIQPIDIKAKSAISRDSPGHSGLFVFYNQKLITIKQGLEPSVPLTIGRSVRAPPQDGANIERPD